MTRPLACLLLLLPLFSFAQDTKSTKEIYNPWHRGMFLEKALKDPLRARHVIAYEYSDSVFPNAAILQLKNIEHLTVQARMCRARRSDSLLPVLKVRIDTNGLKTLTHLRYLSLAGFDFHEFPEGLFVLEHLKGLALEVSFIDSVPPSIVRMKSLELLSLRLNNVSRLPGALAQMDSLVELDLSNNRFTEIPPVILRMKNLRTVVLANIEGSLPIEISWNWPYPVSVNRINYFKNEQMLRDCLSLPTLKYFYLEVYSKEEKMKLSADIKDPALQRKIAWRLAEL